MGGYNIIFAALFQVLTPPQLLGRTNTCIDSIITVAMPVGSLLGGLLISVLPLKIVMTLNALALVVTGLVYFLDKKIYRMDNIGEMQSIEVSEME